MERPPVRGRIPAPHRSGGRPEPDPRVTVCIWQHDDPYRYVEIRGEVVKTIRGPEARAHIDAYAQRYVGRDYDPTQIVSERVLLKIRPRTDR